MDSFKKLIENLKGGDKNKLVMNLVIGILVVILLLVLSNSLKSPSIVTSKLQGKNTGDSSSAATITSVTREYEQTRRLELKNLLENTAGVGRVEVAVHCECGEELVPAENTNTSTSVTNEKEQEGGTRVINQQTSGSAVVMSNQGGENSALILKKYNPKVTGVCIVAEGAEEKITELRIKLAVMKYLKITEEQITVLPMKK